jgi:hypothetical protein
MGSWAGTWASSRRVLRSVNGHCGRDTLHGALGFIGFRAINMPIGVLPPSISLDISATASVPQVS